MSRNIMITKMTVLTMASMIMMTVMRMNSIPTAA